MNRDNHRLKPGHFVFVAMGMITLIGACRPSPEEMDITPGKGPSGTTATIAITNTLGSHPITIDIGSDRVQGTTDADGSFSTSYNFTGRVGDIRTVRAYLAGEKSPIREKT